MAIYSYSYLNSLLYSPSSYNTTAKHIMVRLQGKLIPTEPNIVSHMVNTAPSPQMAADQQVRAGDLSKLPLVSRQQRAVPPE